MSDSFLSPLRIVAFIAVGVVAGAAGGLLGSRGAAPAVTDAPEGVAVLRERVASLEEALAAESRERVALEDEIASLRGQLELVTAIFADGDAASTRAEPPTSPEPAAAESDAAAAAGADEASAPPALPDAPWFDAASLAAMGLREQEIERLRVVWEEYELDKLYIADDAARGGARRLSQQQRDELEAQVRGNLGDSEYDLLLYASGQPNRVRVLEVLESSPGGVAGLERGDVILSYDGGRIFRPRDLRAATSTAPRGNLVWIEVLSSDGSERYVQIPAGPIGIKMMPDRVAPAR